MTILKKGIKVLELLEEAGFQAFIVGGAVRDISIGLEPNDIDICTDALPEETLTLFPKNYPSGIEFGTVTVFFEDEEFEITTFRTDGEYTDGRKPEGVFFTKSLEEDLSRRDITINSLAMNSKEEVIDIFGGLEDIKNGVIKAVGVASDRFSEDALRILRVFRFSARFGFEIERNTLEGIIDNKEKLSLISSERIRSELLDILKTENVSSIMHLMYKVGIFDIILKELSLLFNVEQNNPYHVFNLSTHTFKSVEEVQAVPNLKVAMLLHDLGKAKTKETVDGKDSFHGHNKVSVEIAESFLANLKFSNKDKAEILELIYLHDRDINLSEKSVRKLINKLEHTNLEKLIEVKKADILAQNPKYLKSRLESLESIISLAGSSEKITMKDLNINGHDLMERGFQGSQIGATLNRLLDVIIDNPKLNKKDELIKLL